MSNKPFIQVNGKFFRIIVDGANTKFAEVSADEVLTQEMENIVISPIEEMQTSLFQEIIDNARNDLKTSLEKNLKSTVLSSLGFEKDNWGNGGFRVDHCNGRMSAVTGLIAEEVRKRLLEVEIGKDFDLTAAEKSSLKREMKKDFEEAYRRQIRDLTWSKAEALAKAHVDEYIKTLMSDKLKTVATAMLEKTLKDAK